MLVEGKVAIVTGAGRGIGLEYAKALAREGARVGVAEVDADGGRAAERAIRDAGGEALFVETDVSSLPSTEAMARAVAERFGGIDVLVNNAAIYAGLPFESIEAMPPERFDRVMAVNVKGVWLATRACLPYMRKRGGGAVMIQSSLAAYVGSPNRLHYNTSKSALIGMTKALARELAPDGIRVNCLAPGAIGTEATLQGVPKEILENLAKTQCVKRLGTEADLVGPMLYLVSSMSTFMTGQVMVVDGGVFFLS
ncbi:MAG: SDR family NAD(P)-dependent oxidoreductase [Candidatus Binatia bacterium]